MFFYMGVTRWMCDHKGDEPDHANWDCKEKKEADRSITIYLTQNFRVFCATVLLTIYDGVWFSTI
jgi:hypothetical protein